ncbi:branched-chain amino acid ABC transporter permease [Halopenitus sp. POP-27]|uniref:branched-chain amino acid ABC transporter permease n=1 Tax=Halopenitus sp. POP-27 TaxID=2994425 RepID=UPI00246868E5|nr:branched-chain amino acid ABC transporter permease [Halopenitus sp. POP-27]
MSAATLASTPDELPSLPWVLAGLALLAVVIVTLAVRPGLFISNLVGGIVYGMILMMIALGLSLILGLLGVVNFAHGALFMLGAYGAYQAVALFELPFWLALIVVPIGVGLIGVLMEVTVLRRLYGEDPLIGLLATFGVALMLEEATRAQWGGTPLSFDPPAVLRASVQVGFLEIATTRLFTAAVGALVVGGLYLLMYRTDFGLSIRAGLQDQQMAEFLGIDIPKRFTIVFFIGAAIAGLSGVLRGAEVGMDLGMGMDFVILAFVVIVVGGLGSIFGSVVSALLIGVAVFVTPVMLRAITTVAGLEWLYVSGIGGLMPFLVMIGVLLVRPRGLFGEEGLLE